MNATLHDAYASTYDQQTREYGCWIADALFGLCFEYVQPGQRCLDLGIGSGLSALPFVKAGVQVEGMDFSPAMLEIARSKGIAVTQHDLLVSPWPYEPGKFTLLICCGVFHFIPELDDIFGEAHRVLQNNGIFAFTIKMPTAACTPSTQHEQRKSGDFDIFSHCRQYIQSLMEMNQFSLLKQMTCLIGDDLFEINVTQKAAA